MNLLWRLITIIILLAAVAIGVMFALQNKQAVPVDMLIFSLAPRSLALWLLVAFALGGVAGLLISTVYMLRSRAALSSSRRQLTRVRAQLEQARTTESKVGG